MRHLLPAVLLLSCAAPRATPTPAKPVENEVFLCRFKLNPYYLPAGELRLRSDLPPFATVDRAEAAGVELTLPWGPSDHGLLAKFTSGWVTVRASLRPKEGFTVASHEPLTLSPVLSFDPGARLEWLDSTDDSKMLVEVQSPKHFRSATALRTKVRCEDATIGKARGKSSERFGLQGEDAGKLVQVALAPGVEIPVSATPGGPLEGTLRYEKGDWGDSAEVLGEQKGFVQVRKHLWPGVVTGWVAKEHTRPFDESGGMSSIFGALGGSGRSEGSGKPPWPRCTEGVDLYVTAGGRLSRVGEVFKGAAVLQQDKLSEWTTVRLPELGWIQLMPGVSWALKDGDLEKCIGPARER